jgi:GPH family glycoside/pentoside/hexuronide:cation symporter
MRAAPSTDRAAAPVGPARPFGLRDRVGYTLGDVGNNLTFYLQAAFFLVFCTDVMGIRPAHVGTLLLTARLLDAFTDIAVGRLVDRLPAGPAGRFRPWLLRGMVPLAIATTLLFAPLLQDAGYGVRLTWMTLTYVLWGAVCYTLVNIPYGSMVSVISPRPEDRAALSVARSLGGYLGFLLLAGVLPLLVYVEVDGRSALSGTRMMVAAAVCGVLAIGCYLLCYLGVQERVRTPPRPREERMGAGALLLALVTNRALTGIVVVSLLMLVSTTMLAGMLPYIYGAYFGDGRLLSVANIAGLLPVLAFLPVATLLARRLGKKELGIAGLLLATASALVLFVVRTDSPIVFTIGYALLMLGCAAVDALIWAVISDVIDVQELATGERPDGTVVAIHSWSRKIGQALAGGLSGWALGWIGYEASAGRDGGGQDPAVLESLYSLTTLGPALLLGAAALVLALWFPLSKRRVQENSALG